MINEPFFSRRVHLGVVVAVSILIMINVWLVVGYASYFQKCGDQGAVVEAVYANLFTAGAPIWIPTLAATLVVGLCQGLAKVSVGSNRGWIIAAALAIVATIGFGVTQHIRYPLRTDTEQDCISAITV